MAYSSEADNKLCVRRNARVYEVRFGRVRLNIFDWSNCQWELRALIFLPDDHRNRNHGSGNSNVPALRYGETELSYEGHQEHPDLRDTSMNRVSVHNLDVENIADLRKPPADTVSCPSREGKPYIEGRSDQGLLLLNSEGRKRTSFRTFLTEFQPFHSKVPATSLVGTPSHLDPTRRGS